MLDSGAMFEGSLGRVSGDQIFVFEEGRELAFSFEGMLAYHGGGSPGGVAHAFKVLQRAVPLLAAGRRAQRREVFIETAFGGPGARDAFELVTRAVTEQRFVVDATLSRPDLGRARERFVFRLRYRGNAVTLTLRAGFVTDEFIDLTRQELRSADDAQRLAVMKSAMADRVMSADAASVYDVSSDDHPDKL
jgi:hypothetical protein